MVKLVRGKERVKDDFVSVSNEEYFSHVGTFF